MYFIFKRPTKHFRSIRVSFTLIAKISRNDKITSSISIRSIHGYQKTVFRCVKQIMFKKIFTLFYYTIGWLSLSICSITDYISKRAMQIKYKYQLI